MILNDPYSNKISWGHISKLKSEGNKGWFSLSYPFGYHGSGVFIQQDVMTKDIEFELNEKGTLIFYQDIQVYKAHVSGYSVDRVVTVKDQVTIKNLSPDKIPVIEQPEWVTKALNENLFEDLRKPQQ